MQLSSEHNRTIALPRGKSPAGVTQIHHSSRKLVPNFQRIATTILVTPGDYNLCGEMRWRLNFWQVLGHVGIVFCPLPSIQACPGTKKHLPWFLLQTHHQLHKVGLHPGMSLRCRRCHLRPSRCISAIWPVMTCAVGSSSINTCETLQSPQAGERHLLNHHPMDLRPRSAPCTVTSQYWSPTHDWSSCCFPHMVAYRGSGLY